MLRCLQLLTNAFPVWVLAASVVALFHPAWFTWFQGPWITWGLAVIMLGMGITLSFEDFRRVIKMPGAVTVGFIAQFTIMPLLGWSLGKLFGLPTPLAVGLILVACCPGGTASNVVTFLAGADVALSVLMTMCSTLAAVIMTPGLTWLLAGTYVHVDAWGLCLSTFQVVFAPVILGLLLHQFFPRLVDQVLPVAPLTSVLVITLICASVIGQSANAVLHSALSLLASVFCLHAGGFGLGYLFSRLAGHSVAIRRTISIEVGMQNSGLGVVLAKKHFPDPLTAVPAAISAVFHSIIGSILAGIWRLRRTR